MEAPVQPQHGPVLDGRESSPEEWEQAQIQGIGEAGNVL